MRIAHRLAAAGPSRPLAGDAGDRRRARSRVRGPRTAAAVRRSGPRPNGRSCSTSGAPAAPCRSADCGAEITSIFAPSSASATAPPAWPTTPSSTGSATSSCSASRGAGLADGRPIKVGGMKGRSRAYPVEYARRFAYRWRSSLQRSCDVVVATVVADRARLTAAERVALDFLNGRAVLRWAERDARAR